jgi:hypothetical protein
MVSKTHGHGFIVGCIRSGTTLLQSLLTAHSRIASFPETMFFRCLTGDADVRWRGKQPVGVLGRLRHGMNRARIKLGIAHRAGRERVQAFLREINRGDLTSLFPRSGYSLRQQARACIRIFDAMARDQGKDYWVEKSPDHLAYIDIIERHVPDAKFIHIVRNGADVVASIFDCVKKYPNTHWDGNWGTVAECVAQWNHSLRLTVQHRDRLNHRVVTYRDLVDNPRLVLTELCAFLGVAYEETMIQDYPAAARQVVLPRSVWKQGVFEPIRNTGDTKFFELFNEEERHYILNNLTPNPFLAAARTSAQSEEAELTLESTP